jgi:peptidoglycan/LPS O-acetylase OafA/YrhL
LGRRQFVAPIRQLRDSYTTLTAFLPATDVKLESCECGDAHKSVREALMSVTDERPRRSIEHRSADRGRVPPLDGLRTIAIAFVVLYHLNVPFFDGGFIGVNIFFALSGYLITSILLREHHHSGRIAFGAFWLRRVIRLYPTLLVVVIVVSCLWTAISAYSKSNVDVGTDALLALSYSGNIARWIWHKSMGPLAQTWSLAMEEQFYLVWPPLLALLLAKGTRRVVLISVLSGLMVATTVGSWLLYKVPGGGATPDIYFSPLLNVGPLLCGAVLALLAQSPRVRERLAGRLGMWLTAVGACALIAIELSLTGSWTKQPIVIGLVLPLVGIGSTFFIAGLTHRQTVLSRLLSARPLAWFGRHCSYGVYLWHVMLIALILPAVPGPLGIPAAILASIVVSIGSHYAIERPLLALKRRIHPRAPRARSALPAGLVPDEVWRSNAGRELVAVSAARAQFR